ncbi:MAG: diaminopimelate decarboxylase [Rhodocyclales bacterium]|jgi:diaminopimelate decarboxylase|nr:MAG: diaminopimelate decarboxylase [Rhodocyclales bacterium]GIK25406.1 MAG: diaminopimelate decarboxylase [Betaproteobacteria bacterium]
MSHFAYRDGMLHAEDVPLPQIAAAHGTPCFVYSRAALLSRFEEFRQALAGRDTLLCYAVKANSNLAILNLFARAGAGFDIVSGGELARVIAAGGDPARVVFSGVGKTKDEMHQALVAGIFCFNVESSAELERLDAIAGQAGKRASIALRVNPDVDAKTHPYISTGLRSNKFGVAYAEALDLYRRARVLPNVDIAGIACHIGSQLLDPAPAAEAAEKILALADRLAADGIVLRHLDLGGGIGIRYRDETPLPVAGYLAPVLEKLAGRKEKILFEPGRALVGNAGVLLTRIEHLKHGEEKNFAIVDAAMNDLMRPALYDAWHDILPVRQAAGATAEYEVVGPVCESGDFLGHARALAVAEGDLLSVMSAGAYGMAMSSNYNTRPRAAEVMVDGNQIHLVRERERIEQLFAGERVLP